MRLVEAPSAILQPGVPVSEIKRVAAVYDMLDWLSAQGVKVQKDMKKSIMGVTDIDYEQIPAVADRGALHVFRLRFGSTEVSLYKRETRSGTATLPLKISLVYPFSQLPSLEWSPINEITQFHQKIKEGPDVWGMTFIDESTGFALRVSPYGDHQVLRIKA